MASTVLTESLRNFRASLELEEANVRKGLRDLMRRMGSMLENEAKYGAAGRLFKDDTGTLRESISYKVWTGRGFGNSYSASLTVGPRSKKRDGGSVTIGKNTYHGEPVDVLVYAPIVHDGRPPVFSRGGTPLILWLSRRTGKVGFARRVKGARSRPFMEAALSKQWPSMQSEMNNFVSRISYSITRGF